MPVVLDHHIIPVKDKEESASFLAGILGVPYQGSHGAFASVRVGETLLDFSTREPVPRLHYAFKVDESEFEGVVELFGPIHDGGAETVDRQPGAFEIAHGEVKSGIGDIVKIGFGITRHFDATHFDIAPVQLATGLDLAGEGVGGFIADTG